MGSAAVATIGAAAFGEPLGWPQWVGIALVIAGAVALNIHVAN